MILGPQAQNDLQYLIDSLAAVLVHLPTDEQRARLVHLFARLDEQGGKDFDAVLGGAVKALQDWQALGRLPGDTP